jgi:oligopeptide/dipeptide ABC transporter ATP-binding protein
MSTMIGPEEGAAAEAERPVLEVTDLRVRFPMSGRHGGGQWLTAVDGVSFTVPRGRTFALVGESGSGKTTVARTIVRLQTPEAGHVRLEGTDLTALQGEDLRRHRRRFQMVFQDPYSSLDPRQTVANTVAEPLRIHGLARGREIDDRVERLLASVGLDGSFARRRPHECSGGQRQRIGIARALAVEPTLLVCDEPVSALDVSIRAQVINLLADLQAQLGITYVFIAHDLAVVRQIASSVGVMYLGRIVEAGTADAIYAGARHPYSIALLSAVPVPDATIERKRRRIILTGDIPNPADPPSGCRFHGRCWMYEQLGRPEVCSTTNPELDPVGPAGEHRVACHFADTTIEAARRILGDSPASTDP